MAANAPGLRATNLRTGSLAKEPARGQGDALNPSRQVSDSQLPISFTFF